MTWCLALLLTDSLFFPLDVKFFVVEETLTKFLQVSLFV